MLYSFKTLRLYDVFIDIISSVYRWLCMPVESLFLFCYLPVMASPADTACHIMTSVVVYPCLTRSCNFAYDLCVLSFFDLFICLQGALSSLTWRHYSVFTDKIQLFVNSWNWTVQSYFVSITKISCNLKKSRNQCKSCGSWW